MCIYRICLLDCMFFVLCVMHLIDNERAFVGVSSHFIICIQLDFSSSEVEALHMCKPGSVWFGG